MKNKRLYSKSKLELNSKKVELESCKNFFVCVYIFLFALKTKLKVLNFETCQIKLRYRITVKLQLTGKISLKLDSNSSLYLEYGR